MTDLATRVEAGPPSRELADEVLRAFGREVVSSSTDGSWIALGLDADGGPWQPAPDPLTSLDAALELVPEGWWTIHAAGGNLGIPERPFDPHWHWGLARHATGNERVCDVAGEGQAPAQALTAACLRAREASDAE